MKAPPKIITILVDSREQYPLLFPATMAWFPSRWGRDSRVIQVRTETLQMATGDYAIKGKQKSCLIERKGCVSEIAGNLLTRDYNRSMSAFNRLASETSHPYLLIDETPAQAFRVHPKCPNPRMALDAIFRLIADLGIGLIWAGDCKRPGPRRILGEQMVRLMLCHAFDDCRARFEPVTGDAK